jgi:hypothetical protein
MALPRKVHLAGYLSAIFILLHAMLFYGLPLTIIVGLWFALSIWFYLAGPAAALLSAFTIATFTLLLNFSIQLSGLDRSMYYRAHELMKAEHPQLGGTFRPNTQFSMAAQFGDIEAMEKAGVRENPHDIAYQTDSLGFRNPTEYDRQSFVLLGDSFVAGANDTQSCLVGEPLRQDHGLDTYNLGFPGDMEDYIQRFEAFRREKGDHFKVALFVFEGNDFKPFRYRPAKPKNYLGETLVTYSNFFRESSLWRYTRWLYLRVVNKNGKGKGNPLVRKIGTEEVAFLSTDQGPAHNQVPYQESRMKFADALQRMKPNLVQVFFIPIKYRVYAQWLTDQQLSNTQWDYLSQAARQANVDIFDLTPTLVDEARRLLPQGQYVYWRDDTHWNCAGIRAIAAPVAQQLRLH